MTVSPFEGCVLQSARALKDAGPGLGRSLFLHQTEEQHRKLQRGTHSQLGRNNGTQFSSVTVIPFLVGVVQVGGSEAELELGHVFGVVDASGEHLGQVGRERGQSLRQVGVKTLRGNNF